MSAARSQAGSLSLPVLVNAPLPRRLAEILPDAHEQVLNEIRVATLTWQELYLSTVSSV